MSIFDKYYNDYDYWYELNKDLFVTELNTIRKFSLKGKGIEIGVGTGRFAAALNIKYGIDPSLNMLKIARQRGIETEYAKGESNPYENNTFDFALIAISICFIEDPLNVLKETYRVLKKGGFVVLAILRENSAWVKYYRKKKSRFYQEATFYNVDTIISLFDQTGFRYNKSFQSLFKGPDTFSGIEEPEPGYDRGSFVALSAIK